MHGEGGVGGKRVWKKDQWVCDGEGWQGMQGAGEGGGRKQGKERKKGVGERAAKGVSRWTGRQVAEMKVREMVGLWGGVKEKRQKKVLVMGYGRGVGQTMR